MVSPSHRVPSAEKKTLGVRVTKDVYDRIVAGAAEAKRSLGAEAELLIEAGLREKEAA